MCRDMDGCSFYTFFTETLECFLLSHLIEPTRPCDDCRTGPSYCNDDGQDLDCSLVLNGKRHKTLKLTDTSKTFNVSLLAYSNGNANDTLCVGNFFLVGGGGNAPYFGGGGSGQFKRVAIDYHQDDFAIIKVGDTKETTHL